VCRSRDTREADEAPFAVGENVEHPEFGSGVVMTTSGDRLLVLFRTHGYRMLATDLIVDHDLLVASAGS
jgi:ATP-dependent DNA helicase RecQ